MKDFKTHSMIFLTLFLFSVHSAYAGEYGGIVEFLTKRAMDHVETGNIEEAAHDFKKILLVDSGNPTAKDYMGRADFKAAVSLPASREDLLKGQLQDNLIRLQETEQREQQLKRELNIERDLSRTEAHSKDIQLAKMSRDINDLDAQLNSPQVKIDRLAMHFLKEAADIHQKRARLLQEKQDKLKEEILAKDKLYQKQIAGLREEIESDAKKLLVLNMDLVEKNREITSLQGSLSATRREINQLGQSQTERSISTQLEFEEIKNQLQKKIEELQKKDQIIEELTVNLSELNGQRALPQPAAAEKTANTDSQIVKFYQKEIAGLKGSLSDKETEISDLGKALELFKDKLVTKDSIVKEQRNFIESLQKQVEEMEMQVKQQKGSSAQAVVPDPKLAEAEDLLNKTLVVSKKKDEEIALLNKKIAAIKKGEAAPGQYALDMVALRDEVSRTQSRLEDNLKLLEQKNAEISRLNSRLDAREKGENTAVSRPGSGQQDMAALKDRLKVFQDEQYQLRKTIEEKEDTIRSLEDELDEAYDRIDEKHGEYREDERVVYLEQELAEMRGHFQSSIQLLDEREKMIKSLRQEISKLQEQKSVSEDGQYDIVNLRNQLDDAKVRIFELKNSLEEKNRDIKALEESLSDTQQRLELTQRIITEKDKQIGQLQGSLEQPNAP